MNWFTEPLAGVVERALGEPWVNEPLVHFLGGALAWLSSL